MNLSGSMGVSLLLHGSALVVLALAPGVVGMQSAPPEEPLPLVRMQETDFRPAVAFFAEPPAESAVEEPVAPAEEPPAEPPARDEVTAAAAPAEPTPARTRPRPAPRDEVPVIEGGDAPAVAEAPEPPVEPAREPQEAPCEESDPPEAVAAEPAEPADDAMALAGTPQDGEVDAAPREGTPDSDDLAMALPDRPEPATAPAAPSVDVDALFANYAASLERLIERHRSYPRVAQRAGLQGTVVLEVRIDAQGNIREVRVLRSSGHGVLDRAALASIERIGRFDAPPSEVPWDHRPIEIPLQYTL
ncbi:MAG: energy transducer TonB [Deltaproteobacteria bacterium]|nr:MAG: energy transducer TonB [Deltaproteobacteria bacterium]